MKKIILAVGLIFVFALSASAKRRIYEVNRSKGDKVTGLYSRVSEVHDENIFREIDRLNCNDPGSTVCGWTTPPATPGGSIDDITNEVMNQINAGVLSGSFEIGGVSVEWNGTDSENFHLEISYEIED